MHIRHVFTVQTLAYLTKGGRLTKFKGIRGIGAHTGRGIVGVCFFDADDGKYAGYFSEDPEKQTASASNL